jgi:hypothetical protein
MYVGNYSLMSDYRPLKGLLAWEETTLDWIPSGDVRTLLPGEEATIRIHQLEYLSEGIMAVKIRISPKQYYFFEVRERVGSDSLLPRSGVLVTLVNENVGMGYGPVRLVDAHPTTKFSEPGGLDDAPFDLGTGENSTFADKQNGISFVILQKGNDSYLIHFTKPGSIEAAMQTWSKIPEAE